MTETRAKVRREYPSRITLRDGAVNPFVYRALATHLATAAAASPTTSRPS